MKVMGIDPGYATIGYGIIDCDQRKNLSLIDYGVIRTSKEESTAVRLAMINEHLTKLINLHQPDEIVVEQLFFNTNITTGIKVAEARGVILLCSILNCGLLYEYTPLQVKVALTGNGVADKKQIQYMVKAILNIKETPKPDDAADALAIAICHCNTNTHRIIN